MLNKKICKKCLNEYSKDPQWHWQKRNNKAWNDYDEVSCMRLGRLLYVKIEAPEECPYVLEHMVMNQNAQ